MQNVTNIIEATADAARMFSQDGNAWMLAISYEYDVPGVGMVGATISRDDVRRAFEHGLIACPVCGDSVEYCSTFAKSL